MIWEASDKGPEARGRILGRLVDRIGDSDGPDGIGERETRLKSRGDVKV